MIAGATGAGKTTLLRAIANEIPPEERLITVERTLELGLDHLADLHPDALALEERPPNGEGQGAVTMSQLVQRTLRMSPGRVVVGEVLGSEVVAMLNAMMQGNTGSLSTIHARTAEDVFLRVATYAIQSREQLDERASAMLFHAAIDFVVYIERVRSGDGRSKRVVTSIREITGVDDTRVQSSEVFGGAPPGQPAQPRYAISTRRAAEFRAIGYEPPSATGWMG
jgi:Flp pilus assembly CpaF family ATPase